MEAPELGVETKSPHIGIDISPLFSQKTGIGYYVEHLVRSVVPLRQDFQWSLFKVPGRKVSELDLRINGENCRVNNRPWVLPARLTSLLLQSPWQKWVTLETFLGKIDLFHSTNFFCFSQKRGKRVITVYDLTPFLFPEYHPRKRVIVFKKFLPASLKMADQIIAISQNTKQDLMEHFQVPAEKITVTYLAAPQTFQPVHRQEAEPVLSRYGLSYQGYFLYIGAFEPRKNLIRLLDAYELFRAKGQSSIPLVLVGASGWLNHEFYRRLERSIWREDTKVLGYFPEKDLPVLYSGALVFVYPSLYEGFGLPPLEAMACGTPVVTSNNSSLPEVTGDAAILVNPLEVNEIADALIRIVGDFSLQEQMRRKGLQRAKLFTWEETAKKTLGVYESVLNRL